MSKTLDNRGMQNACKQHVIFKSQKRHHLYKLEDIIAEGSSSFVCSAETQQRSRSSVAIKFAKSAEDAELAKEELRMLYDIGVGTNTVGLIDTVTVQDKRNAGRFPQDAFLVMEQCATVTWEGLFASEGWRKGITRNIMTSLMAQIWAGLDSIHGQRWCVGDISASNILFSPSGQLKLCGFFHCGVRGEDQDTVLQVDVLRMGRLLRSYVTGAMTVKDRQTSSQAFLDYLRQKYRRGHDNDWFGRDRMDLDLVVNYVFQITVMADQRQLANPAMFDAILERKGEIRGLMEDAVRWMMLNPRERGVRIPPGTVVAFSMALGFRGTAGLQAKAIHQQLAGAKTPAMDRECARFLKATLF